MPASPRINFVLTEELRSRLDKVCKETGMPLSLVIRKAKMAQAGGSFNIEADTRGRYWK